MATPAFAAVASFPDCCTHRRTARTPERNHAPAPRAANRRNGRSSTGRRWVCRKSDRHRGGRGAVTIGPQQGRQVDPLDDAVMFARPHVMNQVHLAGVGLGRARCRPAPAHRRCGEHPTAPRSTASRCRVPTGATAGCRRRVPQGQTRRAASATPPSPWRVRGRSRNQ